VRIGWLCATGLRDCCRLCAAIQGGHSSGEQSGAPCVYMLVRGRLLDGRRVKKRVLLGGVFIGLTVKVF